MGILLTQKHLVEALPSQVQYVITNLDSQYCQNTSIKSRPYAAARDLACSNFIPQEPREGQKA